MQIFWNMSAVGSIHIPIPCHEDWSTMAETDRGRHCLKCDKVVRDFRGMNEAAIFKAIAAKPGKICGRVDDAVLTRPPLEGFALVRFPTERLRFFVLAFVMAFGLEVWGISTADAQTVQPSVAALKDKGNLRFALNVPSVTDVVLIGKVLDVYTQDPVVGAQVMAYDGALLLAGAMSDTAGNFELRIPKEALTGDTYQLRLRYMGRERRDHEIQRDVREFIYLIDASQMIDGITISASRYDDDKWGGTLVGEIISIHPVRNISGIRSLNSPTYGKESLYRPLDEWLMMHHSEIHHSGRW